MGSDMGAFNVFMFIFNEVVKVYKMMLDTTVTFGANGEYQFKLGGLVFYGLLASVAIWAVQELTGINWNWLADRFGRD